LAFLPSGLVGITPEPNQHNQFFVLKWANSGRPMKNQAFRVRRANGTLQSGVTDAHGRSPVLDTASQAELLTVQVQRHAANT